MLGSLHRFHGYGSLRPVYQRGQTVRGALVSLKFARRDPQRPYRVAVVVSRKVSRSAVVRNRIRRRVYEQVRQNVPPPQPGTDLVFTVFGEQLAKLEAADVSTTVSELLQKANTQLEKGNQTPVGRDIVKPDKS